MNTRGDLKRTSHRGEEGQRGHPLTPPCPPQQVNNFTAELQAKPEYHKFLIGRGGANIRRVRDKTGARIIFPSPDDTEQQLITIVGNKPSARRRRSWNASSETW